MKQALIRSIQRFPVKIRWLTLTGPERKTWYIHDLKIELYKHYCVCFLSLAFWEGWFHHKQRTKLFLLGPWVWNELPKETQRTMLNVNVFLLSWVNLANLMNVLRIISAWLFICIVTGLWIVFIFKTIYRTSHRRSINY